MEHRNIILKFMLTGELLSKEEAKERNKLSK